MKKLALALMCLVSVAFFASCQKEGQPTITILEGEEYVTNGQVVDLDTEYAFGFVMASSAVTGKELASLAVTIDGVQWANVDLTGKTEYTYTDVITYVPERDSIIGTSTITAIVTDAAGQTATATIALSINQPAMPLFGTPVEWVRKGAILQGNTEEEMKAMGLQWTGSYKEVFATIKPLDNATLYLCNGDDFDNITTDVEKKAYFANLTENGLSVASYRNITTNNSANYNDMLAVVYDGGNYLIHITRAEVEYLGSSIGTQITIKGDAK